MVTEAAWLPHFMQLMSPSLPIGAFSYSQGLEYAVHAGWVVDALSAKDWIRMVLERSFGPTDLKGFVEMYGFCRSLSPDSRRD